MNRKLFYLIIILSGSLLPGGSQAQIFNGGFEADPNFPVGWQVDPNGGAPFIMQSFTPYFYGSVRSDVVLDPFEGQNFVVIKSGRDSSEPNYSRLTQPGITVSAGQQITGAYFFATSDYLANPSDPNEPRWKDWGDIALVDPCSEAVKILLVHKSVADVGDYNSMPGWGIFSHTFEPNEAGTYNLVLFVSNYGDWNLSSYFAVDALEITDGNDPLCPYSLAGDLNGDCKVDFNDFAILANAWMTGQNSPTWCSHCDLNTSGTVDIGDLLIMCQNWLIDCKLEPNAQACIQR
jgi:hypothetical protein